MRYCYILNPTADNQSKKVAFQDCIWTRPYIVIKVLSNNNYTIRTIGTRNTQTLHRIGIRPYVPEQRILDVTLRSNEKMKISQIQTLKSRTTNGQSLGKWIVAQNSTNIQCQTVLKKLNRRQHNKFAVKQADHTDNAALSWPDFSNLTTHVGKTHTYETLQLFNQDHRLRSLDIIRA